MFKYLKREIRYLYRVLWCGWHVNTGLLNAVIDGKGHLIFYNKYFKTPNKIRAYIKFYEFSDGVYLHGKTLTQQTMDYLTVFPLIKHSETRRLRKLGIRFDTLPMGQYNQVGKPKTKPKNKRKSKRK